MVTHTDTEPVNVITRTHLLTDMCNLREASTLCCSGLIMTTIINLLASPMTLEQITAIVVALRTGCEQASAKIACDLYLEYNQQYLILG